MKIFLTVLKLYSGHDFYRKNFKSGITVLVLCTSSDDHLYLYKVS